MQRSQFEFQKSLRFRFKKGSKITRKSKVTVAYPFLFVIPLRLSNVLKLSSLKARLVSESNKTF